MKNPIREYFESLDLEFLEAAIREIREDDTEGIYRMSGRLREVASKVKEYTTASGGMDLMTARMAIFEQFAFKSLKL